MVRKNYFEILNNMQFDPSVEYKNLLQLLSSNGLFEELVDKFLSYRNRKTFISLDKFLEFCLSQADNELERLLIFSEILNDILPIVSPFNPYYKNDIYAIRENIESFLNSINHEFIELENGNQIIVEKNVYASQASQIISETNIHEAIKVLEYNHFANKGNIERKKEILISLAKYLEPLRNELNSSEELKEVLKINNGKISAVDKLFEMYNQFGLRHNNSKQYHNSMTEEECERWYDDIYTSTLFVVLSLDEAQILSRLNLLKSK